MKFRAIVQTCKLCEVRQSDSLINEQRIQCCCLFVFFLFQRTNRSHSQEPFLNRRHKSSRKKKSQLKRIFKLPENVSSMSQI